MKHVGFTRGRAEGDVNWYTAAPTVPMSYLIGKMEVMRLKRRKVDEGGWSLKRYKRLAALVRHDSAALDRAERPLISRSIALRGVHA